jgi:pimeloyl-ACP methyl ester carboxylesterase
MNPVAAQRVLRHHSRRACPGDEANWSRSRGSDGDSAARLLGDRHSRRCQTSHLTSHHPDIRVIAYDRRGHGRSGRGCALRSTLGQLARDLDAVIDTTTPTGHIVLVGHSMGAMTILQYLQHHQSRNTDRITGVGLIASAAADITRHGLGRLLATPLAGGACALAAHIPASAEAVRATAVRATQPL